MMAGSYKPQLKPSDQARMGDGLSCMQRVLCFLCFDLLEVKEEYSVGLFGARRCRCCGVDVDTSRVYHSISAEQAVEAVAKFRTQLAIEMLEVFGGQKYSLNQTRCAELPPGTFDVMDVRAWLHGEGYTAWQVRFEPATKTFEFDWRPE